MDGFKKFMRKIGAYAWQFFKRSFPASMMYFCMGTALVMVTMKKGNVEWNNTKLIWTIVFSLLGVGYNALAMWGIGGGHYDMLVTGNVRRMSMSEIDGGYKMSSHKYVQEYRPWKGFVIGAYYAVFVVFFGILFGANQAKIDAGGPGGFIGAMLLVCFLTSGCSFLPFYFLNQSGHAISYYWTSLLGLIPIVVSGVFYIIGAYSRRNKKVREQMIADKAAQAEAQKVKKINYGGLPGTKPKKHK